MRRRLRRRRGELGCDRVVAGYKGFPMSWSWLFSFNLIA
jgi:hypothetical protein